MQDTRLQHMMASYESYGEAIDRLAGRFYVSMLFGLQQSAARQAFRDRHALATCTDSEAHEMAVAAARVLLAGPGCNALAALEDEAHRGAVEAIAWAYLLEARRV